MPWMDDLAVADGQFGEITVSGPVVTEAYFGLPDANALSKGNTKIANTPIENC